MTRVLIVDDQALFREGLRTVLSARGVDVVGEAANGEDAVSLAAELAPDVVLMDLRMPVLDGVEATRRISKLPHAPRVIALTTFDDDASVFEALRAGALAYNNAKLVKEYPKWPYKSLLDDRLNANLEAKAALYRDADPDNDPPLGGASAGHACTYCHAATADE